VAWSTTIRSAGNRVEAPSRHGTIVAVFSSKGGSGKTFVATSLAVAVAKRWKVDTAVVDLDIDMGDVFAYYGLEPKLAVHDLMALGDQTDRERILEAGSPIIDHLWAYGAPPDPAAEVPHGETVGKLLRSMREHFGFVVVDATADYSDQALAAFDLADTICLVAALDVVGIRHLVKALETLQLIGVPRDRIRVVLNRADSKVGLSPDQVQRIMHVAVDAMIPSSRLVPTALNKGRPVYLDEPRSEIATSIDALADLVAGPALGPAESAAEPVRRRRWFGRRSAEPVPAEPVEVIRPTPEVPDDTVVELLAPRKAARPRAKATTTTKRAPTNGQRARSKAAAR
jgi:pilus assembly protein CpaE